MHSMQAYPSSSEKIGTCIQIMKNTMVPQFSVVCDSNSFIDNMVPFDSHIMLSGGTIGPGRPLYPDNQLQRYRLSVKSLLKQQKIILNYEMEYMAAQKETNDLRCYCAAIGRSLNDVNDLSFTLRKIQKYIRTHFTYNHTGNVHDHSSVELLRTGGGVCQAIAVLAAVILQYTQYPGLLVSGTAFNGRSWGPHMWNAVRTGSGKWKQVDFTFGMNKMFVPCTLSRDHEQAFERTHRYDKKDYSQEALDKAQKTAVGIGSAVVSLGIGSDFFCVNGEVFSIDGGQPVLGMTGDGRFWIRLNDIVNMLGGAMEIIPGENSLWVYLPYRNRHYCTGNGYRFLLKNQKFDIRVLNSLHVPYEIKNSILNLRF